MKPTYTLASRRSNGPTGCGALPPKLHPYDQHNRYYGGWAGSIDTSRLVLWANGAGGASIFSPGILLVWEQIIVLGHTFNGKKRDYERGLLDYLRMTCSGHEACLSQRFVSRNVMACVVGVNY